MTKLLAHLLALLGIGGRLMNLSGLGFVPMSGAVYRNAFGTNMVAGDVDLYTCPAGKRAIVFTAVGYNANGSQTNVLAQVKIGGTYYRITNSQAASANASFGITAMGYVLEPGQILSVNNSQSQVNVWFRIVEFDADVPLKTVRLNALSTGNNTLYTCPAGKTAMPLNVSAGLIHSSGTLAVFNGSGNSRTYTFYSVPNGGSPGITNQNQVLTLNTAQVSVGPAIPILAEGDSYVVGVDDGAATQYVWATLMEI